MAIAKIIRPLYAIWSSAAILLVYGIIGDKDPGKMAGGVILALLGAFYLFIVIYRGHRQRTKAVRKAQLVKEWNEKYGTALRNKAMHTNMNYYPPYSKMPAMTVKGLLHEPPIKIRMNDGQFRIGTNDNTRNTKDTTGKLKKTTTSANLRLTTLEECHIAETNLRLAIQALRKYTMYEDDYQAQFGNNNNSNNIPNNNSSRNGQHKDTDDPSSLSEVVIVESPIATHQSQRNILSSQPSSRSIRSIPKTIEPDIPWYAFWKTPPPPRKIPKCPTSMTKKLLETIVSQAVAYSNCLLCCPLTPIEWYGLGGPERARVDLIVTIHDFHSIQKQYWDYECGLTLGDSLFALSIACGYVQDELEKLRQQQANSNNNHDTLASIGVGAVIGTGIAMAMRTPQTTSEEEQAAQQAGKPGYTSSNGENLTEEDDGGDDSEPPDMEEFINSEEGENVFDKLGDMVEQFSECFACGGGGSDN